MSNVETPRPDQAAPLRVPPHNLEAEMALLSAILANNRAYEKVSEFLRAEHFTDPRHHRIFEALSRLIERGQLANSVTLKAFFDADRALDEIGGTKYLARLEGSAVSIGTALGYGRIILDLAQRRELIALAQELGEAAYDLRPDETAQNQIEQTERALAEIAAAGEQRGGFVELGRAVQAAVQTAEASLKSPGGVSGISTGLVDLDRRLGGLHPSDLVILAGRPSMGKSALATNIAFNAASAYREETDEEERRHVAEGAKVAFFSLEMSAEQLANRLVGQQVNLSPDQIRRGQISRLQFGDLCGAAQDISGVPLFIDDTPALTVSAIRTRSRRLQRRHGLGLIVVDYLQLAGSAGGRQRPENRTQEVTEITGGLKALAKELNVPVLALSQLSRAVEQREDKRPQLADLRESGSIEQDADVVMFIFREQYYLERAEPKQRADESEEKFLGRQSMWQRRMDQASGTAEVHIAKQRHGAIGTITLQFHEALTRFGNLERASQGEIL